MERQALIKFEAFDAAHNKRSFALYPHDVPDVARGRAKLALYAALNKDVLAVRHPDGHLMDPTDTFSAGLDTPYRVERLQVVAAADLLDWTSLGLTREELRARAGSARRSAVLRMPVHGRDIMVRDGCARACVWARSLTGAFRWLIRGRACSLLMLCAITSVAPSHKAISKTRRWAARSRARGTATRSTWRLDIRSTSQWIINRR